jgi:hypothetical protein
MDYPLVLTLSSSRFLKALHAARMTSSGIVAQILRKTFLKSGKV